MIIECISCRKKFEVDPDLIPAEGRNIQCGSCNHIWFFSNKKQVEIDLKEIDQNHIDTEINKNDEKEDKEKLFKKNEKTINRKENALIKYQKSNKFTFGNLLSYIIVALISFVALIILLDTFKVPLSKVFPNLELVLFNLFETLKDIMLFFNDLINN